MRSRSPTTVALLATVILVLSLPSSSFARSTIGIRASARQRHHSQRTNDLASSVDTIKRKWSDSSNNKETLENDGGASALRRRLQTETADEGGEAAAETATVTDVEDGEAAAEEGGDAEEATTTTDETEPTEETGDAPAGGDGTFNNPEEGSLMDKLTDAKDAILKTATSDPGTWTTGQKVGVAIGVFVGFMILVCLIKCCCCKKKNRD